jgi:quinolinate synthase
MKLTTLEDIRDALREMKNVIRVTEEIRVPAKRALDRMLALS